MDAHRLSRFGAHETGIPNRLSDSYEMSDLLDVHNSPDSPLSNRADYNNHSALSYWQEQHSSTDAPSNKNSPYNSSSDSKSSFSCLPANLQDTLDPLQKLETMLMGPDDADEPVYENSIMHLHNPMQSILSSTYTMQQESLVDGHQYESRKYQKLNHCSDPEKILRGMLETRRVDVRGLLIECAKAIAEERLNEFEILVEQASKVISISGEPIQRLGAYLIEGLVARNEASGTRIYRSLRCQQPQSKELLSYMQLLNNLCPYLKFGYMAANGAIADAVKNEDHIHIIDFQIAQGSQWLTLIQALAKRPGGPPHLRITGIDDEVSRYARGDSLQIVAKRLADVSEDFNIPFEFQAIPTYGREVTREIFNIRPGEALAVNFTLQLHHIPDESVDVRNPRDEILRMVKSLSPKVVTLVEQESNTNTTPFLTRFIEVLDYYLAVFESIDDVLPRDHKERINVEQHCLAKDIVNVIACEGKDRVERHELLGKWKSRLAMAGFKQCLLSPYVNSVIKSLLQFYSEKYTLVEKDGAMLLGWKNRNLISASAWR